jgi:hypothetical protein
MEHPFYWVLGIVLIVNCMNWYYMIFIQGKHMQHLRDIAKRKKAKAK